MRILAAKNRVTPTPAVEAAAAVFVDYGDAIEIAHRGCSRCADDTDHSASGTGSDND